MVQVGKEMEASQWMPNTPELYRSSWNILSFAPHKTQSTRCVMGHESVLSIFVFALQSISCLYATLFSSHIER